MNQQTNETFDQTIRIAIIGVGLIGGSLARCLKGHGPYRVIGYSPRESSIEQYLSLGVVDEAYTDLAKTVEQANFVFVCAPVSKIPGYLNQLSEMNLAPGCVVTDVGSTKSTIMQMAAEVNWNNECCFIGGHPMAGSERSGVAAAHADLFENAVYVLTPAKHTTERAIDSLKMVLKSTRANLIQMDADQHDRIVGAISHLPHLIAVGLVNQVASYDDERGLYCTLAAGGFRDITRIASSDPAIWRDILIQNRPVMLDLLADWKSQIESWEQWILSKDGDEIQNSFKTANEYRARVPERRRGLLRGQHECYVDLPDQPGAIGQLATLLGDHCINLSNLYVNEMRADVPGVLRLSFREATELSKAMEVLGKSGYIVYGHS